MNEPRPGGEVGGRLRKDSTFDLITTSRESVENTEAPGPQVRPKETSGSTREGRVALTSLPSLSEVGLLEAHFLPLDNNINLSSSSSEPGRPKAGLQHEWARTDSRQHRTTTLTKPGRGLSLWRHRLLLSSLHPPPSDQK